MFDFERRVFRIRVRGVERGKSKPVEGMLFLPCQNELNDFLKMNGNHDEFEFHNNLVEMKSAWAKDEYYEIYCPSRM